MKALGDHGVFEIQELGEPGAAAYMRVGPTGVSLSVHGHGVRGQDHVIFSISPEDAAEISDVSDVLARAAEISHRLGKQESAVRKAEYVAQFGETVAEMMMANRMPIVRHIAEGMFANRYELRGGTVEDEDVVLGGLSWFRDRLDLRVNEVNTIAFNTETFRQFADIAGNQPDFPEQASVWDSAGK